MKLISEYQGPQGTALVYKNITAHCYTVKFNDTAVAEYPTLSSAEDSAEDMVQGVTVRLPDSTVIESGPVTLTPVEKSE